jgi:hypothetical protein
MQTDMVRLTETADPSRYVAEDLGNTMTVLHHCHLLLPLSLTPHSEAFYSTGKNMKQKLLILNHMNKSL